MIRLLSQIITTSFNFYHITCLTRREKNIPTNDIYDDTNCGCMSLPNNLKELILQHFFICHNFVTFNFGSLIVIT